MLFIDFSSAFNTIIPQQLINKLNLLGLNNSLCNWILDFLTGRPQSVRVGHNTSSTTTLSTGAPQGCVLSPLLFTLLTHDCTAKSSSNHIIKFADDTTVVGLISNNDETHYREEVAQLAEWCGTNNLSLNVEKTKEVVLDFRRRDFTDHPPTDHLQLNCGESAALNSWGYTSRRISPGPPTPCHSPIDHWECADQLHHCLVRELQCCWPQDPPADSEHGCKDHRCPSPIHPGHFPCTMLQQNQQHREGPHPPLPQSLPAPTIRKTVPEHQSPLRQTAQQLFPTGCESPELRSPRPPLKPHANPYLLKHGPPPPSPPPLQAPPNLTTPKKKLWTFLCNSSVLHTGEWACTNHL